MDLSKFKNAKEVNKEISRLEKRIETLTYALQLIACWTAINDESGWRRNSVLNLCRKALNR